MKTNRAYALFQVKAVNEHTREIEGIATTPTTDRMGDIVEPEGASFSLPLPLLWQHDAGKPIGHVTFAKPTSLGITVRAMFARIDEPGVLRDRLEEAWQSVKSGIVRGLSIGFRALKAEPINGGGLRFTAWDWLELSCVTIPANAEATITSVKSADQQVLRAAPGVAHPGAVYLNDPRRHVVVRL